MIKYDIEVVDSVGDIWLQKALDGYVQNGPSFQYWFNRNTGGDEKAASILTPEQRVQDITYFFNPIRVSVTPKDV
jgi:hypothetical protein